MESLISQPLLDVFHWALTFVVIGVVSQAHKVICRYLGLSPKAMDENKCPLGMLGQDINCRKPHQRMGRHADFMMVKIEVDVHEEGLHEWTTVVNFRVLN